MTPPPKAEPSAKSSVAIVKARYRRRKVCGMVRVNQRPSSRQLLRGFVANPCDFVIRRRARRYHLFVRIVLCLSGCCLGLR